MDQYLKQKIPVPKTSRTEDLLNKEANFNEQMKQLNESKPQMVEDFQKPMVKDLGVDKINTRGAVQPITSGADFAARQAARNQAIQSVAGKADNVLDYNQLRREFADKAKLAARSPAGKKLLGAIPLIAPAMALMNGQPAQAADEFASDVSPVYDAIRPTESGPAAGSIDDRIEKGILTDADKAQLRLQALQHLRKN